jgi:hypothetical protein
MSISFHRVAHGYTLGTSLVLNIGNSDFGFVSDFVLRVFWVFFPGIGRILQGLPLEVVG